MNYNALYISMLLYKQEFLANSTDYFLSLFFLSSFERYG